MDYNTFKEIIGFSIPFPYPDKKNYVFSKNHRNEENLPAEFISTKVVEFVKSLKEANGKHIWLVGGGEINKTLLNNDLIDEIILTIKPVILGEGIPMFSSGTEFRKFQIIESTTLHNNFVQIKMRRK